MRYRSYVNGLVVLCLVLIFCVLPAVVHAQPTKRAAEHEKVTVNLLGGPFGVSAYVAAFALADLVNKKSPWLKLTAVETRGAQENIRTLGADPNKKKNHIIMATLSDEYLARMGLAPYDTKYPTLKAISAYGLFAPTFISLDPAIQATSKDFLAKKIGLSYALGDDTVVARAIFEYGFGVPFKQFRVQYLGWEGVLDALADGVLDIAYIGVGQLGKGKFVATPALQKFMASVKKNIHWINFPPDLITKTREKSGLPIYSIHVKAGSLGPKQAQDYDGFTGGVGWWADAEMNPDIPYEIARIIYEYHQEMWPAHIVLTFISPKTMGVTASSEQALHPGALKLFKEHGIKIGVQ
jgi:TRAP transporter TAXI family solute receptor